MTQTFRLALKVAVDPAYEADAVLSSVEAALRSAYAFEAREFEQPVFHSEIDAVCHSVAGVLAVDVDRLYVTAQRPSTSACSRSVQPSARTARDPAGVLTSIRASRRLERCRDGRSLRHVVAATVTGM